jgi:hypothetical protein
MYCGHRLWEGVKWQAMSLRYLLDVKITQIIGVRVANR